jgi:hypothetical protein
MNTNQISHSADDLKQITSEVLEPLSNEYLIDLVKSNADSKYLGVIRNNSLLSDIYRARAFASPSSYYGHRYANNVMCLYDVRPTHGMDLHCTDQDGILKNSINSLSAKERIMQASEDQTPVVFLFGGSTMFGQGSRTPEFTIPALVEKIAKIKHKQKLVCINFGLGGTCSRDALNVLISEALAITKPKLVLFYDGWNCASYLTAASYLKSEKNFGDSSLPFHNGELIRHFEHNLALSNLYSPFWISIRAAKLYIAYAFDLVYRFIKNPFLRKIIVAIHSRLLQLRPSDLIPKLLEKMDIDDVSIADHSKKAVAEYLEIHSLAELICREKGIKFSWLLQPLVFWGNKPLSANEKGWRENGYSSGNPKVFNLFLKELYTNSDFISNRSKLGFHDLSSIFDSVQDELFIDSGHLNRYGNFLVSMAITDIIFKNDLLK